MNGISIFPNGIHSQFDNYNKDSDLTELEKQALSYIKQEFEENDIDFNTLSFRRRSEDYLTILAYNEYDFCRLKVTERSIWFSINGIILPNSIKNDPRFDGVKKSLIHWKIKLPNIESIKDNADLILESYLALKN